MTDQRIAPPRVRRPDITTPDIISFAFTVNNRA
jgi:hypothetical protein